MLVQILFITAIAYANGGIILGGGIDEGIRLGRRLGLGIATPEGIGLGLTGIASSQLIAAPVATKQIIDYQTPAKYEFKYGVSDPKTGDNKQQSEVRVGDVVKGEYSLAEPDGTIRVVKYTSDKINGFNAVVSRIGKAVHPQQIQKAVAVVNVIGGKTIGLGGELGLGGGLGLGGSLGLAGLVGR